ncbi:MAG: thioredoxin family protein, partial [Phaeodactylibacter sp.]|nr:thioredoxin family protein [Phaeodactylibacter sp.]MCB9264224.1 thioredoxin family protein [Lewinellaceae bacterium]MCB9291258.1 thioredoxin family protein [Lewinellaceae bacterium]
MIRIQVLGLGNSQHRKLSHNLRSALESVGLPAEVEQVTDVDDILQYKIGSIPAILLDGQVLFENGHMPSIDELREVLSGVAAAG